MAVGIRTNTDSETLDTSPGGLFTNPDEVTSIDLSTIEGHLNDAVDGARNSKGWAVGNPDDPLTGWSTTNNSKYYSEQSSNSATEAAASATSAAGSASSAATSAGAAGVSASQAAASASSALSSAQTATTQAGIATTQAGLASDSATAAATSAMAAATSETNAATSAREADSDARAVEADLAEARDLAVEVRRLHAEVSADSDELHLLELRVRADSEEIARDVARAEVIFAEIDSEAQVAEAFAVGTGPQAGQGANIDTDMDGFDITSTQDLFSVGGTQFVRVSFPTIPGVSYGDVDPAVDGGGTIALRIVTQAFANNRVVRVFHNYEDLGNKPSTAFDGGANSVYNAIRVSELTRTPIATDTFHIFVTDPGQVPSYESAWFQAQRALEFQDEARQFDSDARARDSEINSLVSGAYARIDSDNRALDSEKVVRANADSRLQQEIDDIFHGHTRIINGEHFHAGYGIEFSRTDSDSDTIHVDTDVIANRAFATSEAERIRTEILDGADPAYDTLLEIQRILETDSDLIASLLREIDSDSDARGDILRELRQHVIDFNNARMKYGLRDSELQQSIDTLRTDLNADIDSDAQKIRELGLRDSELQAEITRLEAEIAEDSELIRALDSELRARLDTDGGAVTSFRSLTDTPNAYDSDSDGFFTRSSFDRQRLEFFNPFPVTNNRLTSLNGLRIRRFETDAIVFATFEPSGLSLNVDPSNFVQWDRTINGFQFIGTNDDLVQDTFLTNITNYTVNDSERTISTNYTTYATSRTWDDPRTFISPNAWTGGSEQFTAVGDINDSAGGTYRQTRMFGWNTPSWNGPSDNWGSMRFDAQQGDVTVEATPLTDNVSRVTNVTIGGGAATQSGSTFSRVFTGPFFYDDSEINANFSGTFTKPAHSNSNSSRSATVTHNYSADHGDIYFPTFQTTTNTLGNVGTDGYNGALTVSERDQDLTLWLGRRYTFTNSTSAAQTHYIWAPSPATGFTDPDSLNAAIAGVVHTTPMIGQTGHQRQYNRYAFTVAANSTLRADPTS